MDIQSPIGTRGIETQTRHSASLRQFHHHKERRRTKLRIGFQRRSKRRVFRIISAVVQRCRFLPATAAHALQRRRQRRTKQNQIHIKYNHIVRDAFNFMLQKYPIERHEFGEARDSLRSVAARGAAVDAASGSAPRGNSKRGRIEVDGASGSDGVRVGGGRAAAGEAGDGNDDVVEELNVFGRQEGFEPHGEAWLGCFHKREGGVSIFGILP